MSGWRGANHSARGGRAPRGELKCAGLVRQPFLQSICRQDAGNTLRNVLLASRRQNRTRTVG